MSAGDVEGFAIDLTVVRAWKRYPAYKDSGVEWLGEVPAGLLDPDVLEEVFLSPG